MMRCGQSKVSQSGSVNYPLPFPPTFGSFHPLYGQVFLSQHGVSQSILHRWGGSPRILLEQQIFSLFFRFTDSEALWVGSNNMRFSKLSRWFWCTLKFKKFPGEIIWQAFLYHYWFGVDGAISIRQDFKNCQSGCLGGSVG